MWWRDDDHWDVDGIQSHWCWWYSKENLLIVVDLWKLLLSIWRPMTIVVDLVIRSRYLTSVIIVDSIVVTIWWWLDRWRVFHSRYLISMWPLFPFIWPVMVTMTIHLLVMGPFTFLVCSRSVPSRPADGEFYSAGTAIPILLLHILPLVPIYHVGIDHLILTHCWWIQSRCWPGCSTLRYIHSFLLISIPWFSFYSGRYGVHDRFCSYKFAHRSMHLPFYLYVPDYHHLSCLEISHVRCHVYTYYLPLSPWSETTPLNEPVNTLLRLIPRWPFTGIPPFQGGVIIPYCSLIRAVFYLPLPTGATFRPGDIPGIPRYTIPHTGTSVLEFLSPLNFTLIWSPPGWFYHPHYASPDAILVVSTRRWVQSATVPRSPFYVLWFTRSPLRVPLPSAGPLYFRLLPHTHHLPFTLTLVFPWRPVSGAFPGPHIGGVPVVGLEYSAYK